MNWEIEYTDEFEDWWMTLTANEQDAVAAHVQLIELMGPHLHFPYSSDIRGARYGNLRELRVQYQGRPYRILYVFDPRRVAILLIGGNKVGDDRWYEKFVPLAEKLYEEHIKMLQAEGEI